MSTFNPMAIANDWYNAYRATALSIVDLYSDDATLECACAGGQVLYGRVAIASYWEQRFIDKPAGMLCDLTNDGHAVAISHWVSDGIVQATLFFDDEGKVVCSRCRPGAI